MRKLLIAAVAVAGFSSPALAQADCETEINQIWAAVQASQLQEEQKGQVGSVLQQAQAQTQSGDEAGCMATVEQVKVALGIESETPGQD